MPKRKKLTTAVQPIAKGKQKQERMTSQERQDQIFEIIQSYMKENGYPPSVRDIGDMANLKSSSTVHGYITKLVEAGRIKRDEEIPRGITLADEPARKKTVNVPLVGTITAGSPILAEENIEETFAFPKNLLGTDNDTFMLRISGESMINAGIYDGDYIMVKQQNTARNGDIVVALVNDETATVKRFYKEKGGYRLQPENDNMEPFFEKNVKVQGIVIGVYRQM